MSVIRFSITTMSRTVPASLSVLVVEDDEDVRETLVAVLEGEGYRVTTAANGLEGLRALAEGPCPSAILSNLTMPHMNGWEFAEAVVRNGSTANIPICVMTALPAGHPVPEHAVGLLRKPFHPDTLLAVLRRCVAGPDVGMAVV